MADYITRKIALPIQTGDEEITNSNDQIVYADPVILLNSQGEFSTSLSDSSAANQEIIISRLPSVLVNDRLKVDVQSLNVTIDNAQLEISNDVGNPIPVNGNVNATLTTIGDIATNTTLTNLLNKIPTSPAQEHILADTPSSVQLSDGTNFYKATTPFDTQPISGVVTSNIGNTNGLALDNTLTNGNQLTKLTDGTHLVSILNSVPTGTEYALVTRTIPSGIQTVNGTVAFSNSTIGVSSLPSLPTGSNNIGSVNVSNFPTTQVVSGSVAITNTSIEISNDIGNAIPISAISLPLPTNASQDRITATAPSAVQLTDGTSFYRPTTPSDTQPISGSVSINNLPSTQNVNVTNSSLTTTVNGTVSLDTTDSGYLNSINNKIPTKGSTTSANSTPVVIANDQASIPVTIQNTQLEISNDIGNPVPVNGTVAFTNSSIQVSNTVAVSGSVTANLNSTDSTNLSNLNTAIGNNITGVTLSSGSGFLGWLSSIFNLLNIRLPVLGQAVSSSSVPVVLPASQITTLTPLSTVTANLDSVNTATLNSINNDINTGNSSLFSIDSKLPSLVNSRLPVDVQSLNVTVSNAQIEIANDVGNPIPVNGTIAFSNSSIGISSLPSIPAGVNSIGSITNSSFGISGTLPSFASIPTFSIDQTNPHTTNKVYIGNDGIVSINGTVPVSGNFYQATQPVSLISLPSLSAGSNIIGGISNTTFTVTQTTGSNLHTVIDSGTISLPTGASTSAKQPALGTAGIPSADVITIQGIASGTPIKVDNSGVTQPISGSVSVSNFPSSQAVTGTFYQSTQPVSLVTLPPLASGTNPIGSITNTTFGSSQSGSWTVTSNIGTGNLTGITNTVVVKADTLANQTNAFKVDGSATVQPVSGSLSISNFPASQTVNGTVTFSNSSIAISGTVPVTGNFYQATQPVSLTNLPSLPTGSNVIGAVSNTTFASTQSGTWNVNVIGVVPLPTGASTSAKQPSLGVAGTPSSDVLSIQGVTNGTAVKVDGSSVNQPVTFSNTSISINGTLPAFTSIPSFKIDQTTPGSTNKVSIGSDGSVAISNTVAVTGSFYQSTQPVSLTSLPSLAAGTNSIGSITNTTFASTQSGTWNINNITGAITLSTGASTSILQTNGNTSLASIDSKTPVIGQTTSASSTPVVIASDQSAIPVSITGLMPMGTLASYLGTSAGSNLKASAGVIYSFTCSNNNSAIRYFQIFNKTSAPALNDVPIHQFPVYPNDGLLIVGQDLLGGGGISLSTGITWGFSTTRLTYTAGAAIDCTTTVRYI